MCRTNPVTFPPVSEFVSPTCPRVGEGAELVDDCDVTDAQESQTLDGQSRDQAGPRYPSRLRRLPERLLPFVSH